MRFLGFLFIIVLIVAAVGYFRGWFTVATSHASGSGEVRVGVDRDRIRDDADKLGELPEKVAEKVRALARSAGRDESELEGSVTAVDVPSRNLSVTVGTESIVDLQVPDAVTVKQAGQAIAFDRLRPGQRVRIGFSHAGSARKLARIEVLP
jgi:hypothetical protein